MWRWGRWTATVLDKLEWVSTRAVESTVARLARVHSFVVRDWRTDKFVPAVGVVLGIALAVVAMYYINNPHVSTFSDTPEYLSVTQRLLAGGHLLMCGEGLATRS